MKHLLLIPAPEHREGLPEPPLDEGTFRSGRTGVRWDWVGGLGWLPDLRDPGTVGCIEHGLLPGAWPESVVWLEPNVKSGWTCVVYTGGVNRTYPGDTKAEALVAALEAAPSKETHDD